MSGISSMEVKVHILPFMYSYLQDISKLIHFYMRNNLTQSTNTADEAYLKIFDAGTCYKIFLTLFWIQKFSESSANCSDPHSKEKKNVKKCLTNF